MALKPLPESKNINDNHDNMTIMTTSVKNQSRYSAFFMDFILWSQFFFVPLQHNNRKTNKWS